MKKHALFEKSLAKTFVKGETKGQTDFEQKSSFFDPKAYGGYVERAKTAIVNKKTEKNQRNSQEFLPYCTLTQIKASKRAL